MDRQLTHIGKFCEEILAKAIMEIQEAAGVPSPFGWDECGTPKVSGAVADAFWGDTTDEVNICRSRTEAVHAYLSRFLELQLMDGAIRQGPFCLRIGGTRDYITGWNVDPREFDAAKEDPFRRILLGGPDFAKTQEGYGHPDTLLFDTHFDAFMMARLMERLDGTHMSIEDWREPVQASFIETGSQPTGTPASSYSSPPSPVKGT
jgi:hypothetical protein